MKHFVSLFHQLDRTTKTSAKIQALVDYFKTVSDEDKVWTIALFTHRRPRRTVTTSYLRTWSAEMAGVPSWLFEESYHIVGDLAETIASILPKPEKYHDRSLSEWISSIMELKDHDEDDKKAFIIDAWKGLDETGRFLLNKLITGGFRVGVSEKSIIKSLSIYTEIDENTIAHRLMGDWNPAAKSFEDLVLKYDPAEDLSKPYPFYLAYALEGTPQEIGDRSEWQVEYKWDGIRGQLIIRDGKPFLWSRGEELVTDKYPEIAYISESGINEVVLDGEIMAYKDDFPMKFNDLQRRIGRKKVGKKLLTEVPVVFMAYDILEQNGEDLRLKSMKERRSLLEKVVASSHSPDLLLSTVIEGGSWEDMAQKREEATSIGSEGLMLKHLDSAYQSGRKKGEWWKWKVDPMTVDAVMLYAQRGHGRRANLYTDFTFAVKDGENLVPFAKAYSGLTDEEFSEITRWVRTHTVERFGPVSSVHPIQVFELAFEGIAPSSRHKSGIAVRFPRIKRWRKDKPASEINTLDDLRKLL